MRSVNAVLRGGSAPATPGFNAVAPEWLYGAAEAAPAVPAAESTLGSHPCVALSSAQVLPEWINRNLAGKVLAANGDNPLNFVSHSKGSLHTSTVTPFTPIAFNSCNWAWIPATEAALIMPGPASALASARLAVKITG